MCWGWSLVRHDAAIQDKNKIINNQYKMVASRLLLILVACYGNEMLFVMEFCTEGVHTPNITLDASFPTNTLLPQGKE